MIKEILFKAFSICVISLGVQVERYSTFTIVSVLTWFFICLLASTIYTLLWSQRIKIVDHLKSKSKKR
jgi:hypothetical protein